MGNDLPLTIPENIRRAAGKYPDNTFYHYLREGWETLSYHEFLARTESLASFLAGSGLGKGERVAIFSENRHEWCTAYISAVTAGCIAVPMDAQLGSDEIANLLADSGSRAVFFSSRTSDHLQGAVRNFQGPLPLMLSFDSPEYRSVLTTERTGHFPDIGPDDIASLIYTSGTTGSPKGVMLTHKNFCSDVDAIVKAGIVSHEDNVLSVLPLHHTYAFTCTFLTPCFLGASITAPASLKGPDLMAAVKEREVSIIIGVPQLLGLIRNGMMNKIAGLPKPLAVVMKKLLTLSGSIRRWTDLNIGSILFKSAHKAFGRRFRFFVSGGARLDPAIMKDLEALGFTVLEGYGLTETSPVITFNPVEKRKPGSAGKPLPSVEIRITEPSETGEGEIAVRGPMLMKGYYRKPELTGAVIQDGWFLTGDVGRMDQDGYLFITGRSKEVIVLSSGKNIYPEEVEARYLASPLIKELCVIGIEENGVTDALHAVIVPDIEYAKKAGIANIQESLKWEVSGISAAMPSYMRIKGYSARKDPLPRTPLGKLRRFLIKGPATSDAPPGAMASEGDIRLSGDYLLRRLANVLRQFLKDDRPIRPEDSLELDLGLDSLAKIELMVALERAFEIKLAEDFMADLQTVQELADRMREHEKQGGPPLSSEKAGWVEILRQGIPEKDLSMLSLESPDSTMLPSLLIYTVLKGLGRIWFRLEAKGIEHIPLSRNYILTPNHTSYLDGFAVILSLPFAYFKNIYSLGLREYFIGRVRSSLARTAHVIPIDSSAYLNKALQMSAHVLREGRSLCVFPEGGRSADGSLMEFKKGVGILAVEMGLPVVPVCIDGAYEALPKGALLPRMKKITIRFGPPLHAADIDFSQKPEGMDDYQYFAAVLKEKVQALMSQSK